MTKDDEQVAAALEDSGTHVCMPQRSPEEWAEMKARREKCRAKAEELLEKAAEAAEGNWVEKAAVYVKIAEAWDQISY